MNVNQKLDALARRYDQGEFRGPGEYLAEITKVISPARIRPALSRSERLAVGNAAVLRGITNYASLWQAAEGELADAKEELNNLRWTQGRRGYND
jgi:hypothetical protein